MGRKIYLDKADLKSHFERFVADLEEQGLDEDEIKDRVAEHYTNTCIRRYSKDTQDRMWDELSYIIQEVPGGVGYLIDNMDYMPEFEHYRFKCLKSVAGYKGIRGMPKK